MSTDYLLFDYLPTGHTPPAPTLLAWYAPGKPQLFGLGVQPGTPFDPQPFLRAFPNEVSEVWVFAEWATAMENMLKEGASEAELHTWLARSQSPAIREREAGQALRVEDLLTRLTTGGRLPRASAMEALFYVLASEGAPELSVQRVPHPGQADFVLLGPQRQVLAQVEIKQTRRSSGHPGPATPSWVVYGRREEEHRMTLITALTEPDYQRQLQAWLDGLAK